MKKQAKVSHATPLCIYSAKMKILYEHLFLLLNVTCTLYICGEIACAALEKETPHEKMNKYLVNKKIK